MFRYKIVANLWTKIIGGDVKQYCDMLARDELVIDALLEIIEKAKTIRLQDLSELVLSTKERPRVYFDVKEKFGLTHNEAQECLFAAIRIVKRRFAGRDDGVKSRVINARRIKLSEDEKQVTMLPQRLVLQLENPVVGKLLSVQAMYNDEELQLRFHLRTPRQEVCDSLEQVVLGVDIGEKISVVVVRQVFGLQDMREEVIGEARHFVDVVEALAFITRYGWRNTLVKIGLPGKKYRAVVDELYYRLLEQKYSVQVVNESYTSVTCSNCSVRGMRAGRIFWCKACDLRMHADENAAVNIARRGMVV